MEMELIAWLRSRLPGHPALAVGLGDDAAVLDLAGRSKLVVAVDMLTDGVHFRLAEVDPRRVGRKALAVNLSDLAAMAAHPLAALVALTIPRSGGLELARQLYEGMLPLAEQYELALAGGDTNTSDGPLSISVTVLGQPGKKGPLRRNGARPGDRILVTGELGGSILGRHLDVQPRVAEAIWLQENHELNAGIDISDGLALDLSRVCQESGCGAILQADAIPISAAAVRLAADSHDGRTPLHHALGDGEDFELLLAAPQVEADRIVQSQRVEMPITCIGRFTAEPGLWLEDDRQQRTTLQLQGFQH